MKQQTKGYISLLFLYDVNQLKMLSDAKHAAWSWWGWKMFEMWDIFYLFIYFYCITETHAFSGTLWSHSHSYSFTPGSGSVQTQSHPLATEHLHWNTRGLGPCSRAPGNRGGAFAAFHFPHPNAGPQDWTVNPAITKYGLRRKWTLMLYTTISSALVTLGEACSP